VVYPGVFVSGVRSSPDASERLNDELVGEDDTEYEQIRTTTSKEERWAATLFEDAFELRGVSIGV